MQHLKGERALDEQKLDSFYLWYYDGNLQGHDRTTAHVDVAQLEKHSLPLPSFQKE